ncbi:MAG: AAA family ATPase [Dolichospermum sp.]
MRNETQHLDNLIALGCTSLNQTYENKILKLLYLTSIKTASISTHQTGDYFIETINYFVDESVQNLEDTYQQDNDDDNEKLISLFSGSESVKSVMHLKTRINNGEAFETLLMSSSKGIIARDIKVPDIKDTFFIPSFLRVGSRELAEEFDKARLKEKDQELLSIFEIIDSSIISIETMTIGEGNIWVKKEGKKRLPLSLFGDAINRIADIILRIVNNENSIILIDEIENGIHHSNQVAFWTILYRLAKELNVQIFATTHSLEMIKSFINAGVEYDNMAAHFELTRNVKTGKIDDTGIILIAQNLEEKTLATLKVHRHKLFLTLNNQHSPATISTITYQIHLIDYFDFFLTVENVILADFLEFDFEQ